MSPTSCCTRETPRLQRKAASNVLTSFHFARLMRISAPILPSSISASEIDWNLTNEQRGRYKLNLVYLYLKKKLRTNQRCITKSSVNNRTIIVNRPENNDQRFDNQLYLFDDVLTSSDEISTICSQILTPILECVVVKETSCSLINFGTHYTQKSKVMIGCDDNHLTPGLIPSAIAWIYRLVRIKSEALKQKYIVKVSFVEVSKNKMRDLLKHLSKEKEEKMRKMEDTTVNLVHDFMERRTHLRASTSDQAAYLFDEAMRYRVNQWKSITDDESSTHLIFSLALYSLDETDSSHKMISSLNILDMGSNYNKVVTSNCRQLLRDPRKTEELNLIESTLHYFTTRPLTRQKMNTVLLAHTSDDGNEFSENIQVIKTASKIFKRNQNVQTTRDDSSSHKPKLGQSSYSRHSTTPSLPIRKHNLNDDAYEIASKKSLKSVRSIFRLWNRQKSCSVKMTSDHAERRVTPRTNVKAWPLKTAGERKSLETWIDGPKAVSHKSKSSLALDPTCNRLLNLPNLDFSSESEKDKTESRRSNITEKSEKSLKNFGLFKYTKKNLNSQPIGYSSPKMTRVVDWVNSIDSTKTILGQYSESLQQQNISKQVSDICHSLIVQNVPSPYKINTQPREVVTVRTQKKKKSSFLSSLVCWSSSAQEDAGDIQAKEILEPRNKQWQTPGPLANNGITYTPDNISFNHISTQSNRKSIISGLAASSGYDSMPGNDGSESEISSFKFKSNVTNQCF